MYRSFLKNKTATMFFSQKSFQLEKNIFGAESTHLEGDRQRIS